MNNTIISSGNTLMDLRLMILRTISQVWKEAALREAIESKTPRQIYEYLAEEFNYHPPFESFGIKFIRPTARWNFYGDNQWTKPEDETITITLPRCEKSSTFNNPEKLFEYYSYFPTMFGLMNNTGGRFESTETSHNSTSSNLAKKAATNSSQNFHVTDSNPDVPAGQPHEFSSPSTSQIQGSSLSRTDFHGNDHDLGVSEEPFLAFGGVMLKLIAAAWDNQELMSILDYNNPQRNNHLSDDSYYMEIKSILKKYYHFEFPWAFNLKFVLPSEDESFWLKKDSEWIWRQTDSNGHHLIRNMVTLEVPFAPSSDDMTSPAMALARYNMIGPAYPFTCS